MLTNAGTKLDMWLFGPDHLYHGEGVPFDPEGVLSTLPAIANVIFGYAAGRWVQEKGKTYEGLSKLLLTGCLSVAVALAWDWFFPINKKLWTGSFVLITVGIDCIILAGLIYVIDFLQIRKWTYFFEVFGKNTKRLFFCLARRLRAGSVHSGSLGLFLRNGNKGLGGYQGAAAVQAIWKMGRAGKSERSFGQHTAKSWGLRSI